MLTEQRHEIILDLLKKQGSITLTEIREKLQISESTARRDLTELDRANKLTKVFGGAVLNSSEVSTTELSVSQKEAVNLEEKLRIAKYAASLIEPKDFIYIDAGTSTGAMIDFIDASIPDVTVVTNAVSHARRLAQKNMNVLILGGLIKGTTEAIIGAQAVLSLEQYHFTKGFFGTNAIHYRHGLTTPDANEAMVKRVAMSHCLNKYVLADYGKFDKVFSCSFSVSKNIAVITDQKPSDYYLSEYDIRLV